jgi:maltose alpha-D-glucosyltransferase/alpha-amylase
VEELGHAINILRDRTTLPEPDLSLARNLIGRHDRLKLAMESMGNGAEGSLRIRIHGDLHLGQVLVAGSDVQIIDFEGEPRKSLTQRRTKASPMRDIAGLVRSFDYVAAQVGRTVQVGEAAAEGGARAEDLLQRFRNEAEGALLAGYDEGATEELKPIHRGLLALFTIEKAAYEVGYEAANRPDWLGVPLRGLSRVAGQILVDAAV